MNPFSKALKWNEALYHCQQQATSYVLVTVLTAAGSTPREAGAKMVVTGDAQYDTIGGGHLEFASVEKARELLAIGQHQQVVESFPLSAKLGQCCGGAVKVLFEIMINHTQQLAIFGAGHVAQSLVPILSQLPLSIRWIDSRENMFEGSALEHSATFQQKIGVPSYSLSTNVQCVKEEDPVAEMASLSNNAWAIILTHNHQLDYELVEQGLKQGRLGFLGMIGSATKAKRFRLRLENRGFSSEQISRLVSPIGELYVNGKRPVEVAVSISAQIINLLNSEETRNVANEHASAGPIKNNTSSVSERDDRNTQENTR